MTNNYLQQLRNIEELSYSFLEECIELNATDIHFNPGGNKQVDIVYRVRGILQKKHSIPLNAYRHIEAFLKGKSGIPKQEKKNFDGRLEYFSPARNKKYFFRVASSWTDTGNATKLTLRLLAPNLDTVTLEELGFYKEDLKSWILALNSAKGIIIVSGPTGSGKSTTLYASLQYIKKDRHVLTIEDPIESNIEDVTQLQVQPGLITFTDHLKIALRHDPDVIMVGEIRDTETAQTSVSAALSGHLVLTTLHANSALISVTRMTDLKVDLFNFVYSLRAIIGQRLLPKLCPQCKEEYPIDETIRWKFKRLGAGNIKLPEKHYISKGCNYCNNLGRIGKELVYELVVFDNEDRDIIFNILKKEESYEKILEKHLREKYSYKTMIEQALEKVENGIIPINAVINYCL